MGIVPTQVYANDLFSKAAPDLSSHMCSVLLALVLLGGATLTALFADKAGRRVSNFDLRYSFFFLSLNEFH